MQAPENNDCGRDLSVRRKVRAAVVEVEVLSQKQEVYVRLCSDSYDCIQVLSRRHTAEIRRNDLYPRTAEPPKPTPLFEILNPKP